MTAKTDPALDATTSFLLERVGLTDAIAATAARLVDLAAEHDELETYLSGVSQPSRPDLRVRVETRQAHLEDTIADVVRDLPETDDGPFRLEFARDGAVLLLAPDGGELVLGSSR